MLSRCCIALLLASFLFKCSAKSLETLLNTTPQLLEYRDLVYSYPDIKSKLLAANNLTIFVASTESFGRHKAEVAAAKKSPISVQEVVNTTTINGIFPSSSFRGAGRILHTNLVEPKYTNVTGGAVIRARELSVLGGGYTKLKIIQADVPFDGGILHIVDGFLYPGLPLHLTSVLINNTGLATTETFFTLFQNRPLSGPERTIISFTDKIWQQLSYFAYTKPRDQLEALLSYNFIATRAIYSPDFTERGLIVPSYGGVPLNFTRTASGKLLINGIKVVLEDVIIDNGVVHVIDELLLPPGINATMPNYYIK